MLLERAWYSCGCSRTRESEWCMGGMREELFARMGALDFDIAKAMADYTTAQEKKMKE